MREGDGAVLRPRVVAECVAANPLARPECSTSTCDALPRRTSSPSKRHCRETETPQIAAMRSDPVASRIEYDLLVDMTNAMINANLEWLPRFA
jgi:hypothetical protein